ncbi:MAG: hypothetical protein ACE5GX_03730 [Thermoanaerobaculia bacterium]
MDRQWIPTVAGVLEIVSGVCALIGGLFLVFAGAIVNWVPDLQKEPDLPLPMITGFLGTLAALILLGGLVCFVGGIAGIRRKGWIWAMAGAIASVFLMPPAGIFALVLAIIGEKEFSERASAAGG